LNTRLYSSLFIFSFVISGVALRLLTLPAHVYAEKLFARRLHATNYLKTQMFKRISERHKIPVVPDEKKKQLKFAHPNEEVNTKAHKLVDEAIHSYLRDHRLQVTRITNLKTCTVPIWIFASFAIRNVLSQDFAPQLSGFLWVGDFMAPDPYFILPVAVGIFGFINLYSQRLVFPIQPGTISPRIYDALLGGMTIAAAYIMTMMPACIPLYWLTVSITGLLQSMALRHPKVKNLFKINRLPWDSNTPIRDLVFLRRRQLS